MIPLGPLRGRLAVARDRAGRAATIAGAAALAAGAVTPEVFWPSAGTAAAVAGWGLAWTATLPKGRVRDTAAALYLSPPAAFAAALTAERLIGRTHWWELVIDAAWAATVWKVRPARMARVLAGREPSLTPQAIELSQDLLGPAVPAGPVHPMTAWWAQRVGIEGGAAPGTVLEHLEQTSDRSFHGVIRSVFPGQPVPAISTLQLSALLDWPEDEIAIAPILGRGAGVRRLTVGQAPKSVDDDPFSVWEQQIAPKGMPGTVITQVRAVDVDDTTIDAKELQ